MAIPTVLGAVVPVYNIPGVNKELNFSGDVIADIYLGKITTWNDARIAKDNPGVNLPANAILPVYRSDGSGTSFIFTDYPRQGLACLELRSGEGRSDQLAQSVSVKREMKALPEWSASRPTPLATSN